MRRNPRTLLDILAAGGVLVCAEPNPRSDTQRNPMSAQFYVARPGQSERHGPFTREQLEEGLRSGRFGSNDLAWETGTKAWVPLATLVMPPMPQVPGMPEVPLTPPMPVSTLPPPPPFESATVHPPQPSGYAPQYAYPLPPKAPWSPLGLIAFIVALAGAGVLTWLLIELWDKYPFNREPMFKESAIGWVAAGAGLLALLIAFPAVAAKQRRGRSWGVVAAIFGGLMLIAGLGGAIFASSWATIRWDDEERSAFHNMAFMGEHLRIYAENHGGRFPASIAEFQTDKEADRSYRIYYLTEGGEHPLRFTPNANLRQPGETIVASDSWSSGRGRRAVYRVDGKVEMTSMDPHPLTQPSATARFPGGN